MAIERYLPAIFLVGVAFTTLGALVLLVQAFRQRWWWGLLLIVFPPAALVFVVKHPRKSAVAAGMIGFGTLLAAVTPAINRLTLVDLGPLERRVDGELHLTLTGWDRKDYSVLRGKPETVVLQMANPDVDDRTLENLAGMTLLRELDLNGTLVGDAGLRNLRPLQKLETLRLRDTRVTDAGLRESLFAIGSLKRLDLRGTSVGPEAVKEWTDGKAGRRVMR